MLEHVPMDAGEPRTAAGAGSVPWALAIAAGIGLAIGAVLGIQNQALGSGYDGGLPRNLGAIVTTASVIGGMALVGVVLALPRVTRPAGAWLLVAAPSALAGFLVASALVPANPGAQTITGSVTVELTAPVTQTLVGTAECEDPGRGDRALIVSSAIGRVGIDELRLNLGVFLGQASAEVRFNVNEQAGYTGTAQLAGVSGDRRAGRATFSSLRSTGAWLGGTSGALLSGSLSWTCAGAAGPAAPVPPTEEARVLQGWFTIHGLITVDKDLPGATPPFPGRASGVCERDLDLEVASIDTVVPWPPDGQARLTLYPERTRATLKIDTGVAPPQTYSASAVLTEDRNDFGDVNGRTLVATFDLNSGPLAVSVDWWCPD